MELENVKSIASKTVTITVASTISAYYALATGELIFRQRCDDMMCGYADVFRNVRDGG
jgi:hypothetical protein